MDLLPVSSSLFATTDHILTASPAFIYPAAQGPQYYRGHTVVLGLLVFAWFMVLLDVLYCAKVNRDKKNGKYNQFIGSGDDRDPLFKMVL